MSNHVEKHLSTVLALAESLVVNNYALSGSAETGPFSRDQSAYRLLHSFSKRIAPKAYRKLTSEAYGHYLQLKNESK